MLLLSHKLKLYPWLLAIKIIFIDLVLIETESCSSLFKGYNLEQQTASNTSLMLLFGKDFL